MCPLGIKRMLSKQKKRKKGTVFGKNERRFPLLRHLLAFTMAAVFSLPGRWPLHVSMRHCVKMCLLMSEGNLLSLLSPALLCLPLF